MILTQRADDIRPYKMNLRRSIFCKGEHAVTSFGGIRGCLPTRPLSGASRQLSPARGEPSPEGEKTAGGAQKTIRQAAGAVCRKNCSSGNDGTLTILATIGKAKRYTLISITWSPAGGDHVRPVQADDLQLQLLVLFLLRDLSSFPKRSVHAKRTASEDPPPEYGPMICRCVS